MPYRTPDVQPGRLRAPSTRSAALLLAAVAAAALLLGALPTPASAQVPSPTITVSPSTGLTDGQVVQVSGTGFPSGTIYVGMCPPGVTDPFSCDIGTAQTTSVDSTGAFSLDYAVSRFITTSATGVIDCAFVDCILGATDLGSAEAQTIVDFEDVPLPNAQLEVSPSTGLLDRQVVQVSGTGFLPGTQVDLTLCPPGAAVRADDCIFAGRDTADGAGAFSDEVFIRRYLPSAQDPAVAIDCADLTCAIAATNFAQDVLVEVSLAEPTLQPQPLVVTPDADLLEGQVVRVSGSSFPPNTDLFVNTCLLGATDPFLSDCSSNATPLTTDASGSFVTDHTVTRFIRVGEDCVEVACGVGVIDFNFSNLVVDAELPVSFADVPPPAPSLQLTPASGLGDGDTVEVAGSAGTPGSDFTLRQCTAEPTDFNDCSPVTYSTTADQSGAFSVDLVVDRLLRPVVGEPLDCAFQTCTIGLRYGGSPLFTTPALGFAEPQLTITIVEDATLEAGTNEVVARALVECDVATPVSLTASVSQPGIEGTHELEDQPCSPGEPLLAFLPTYTFANQDSDFTLGEASVSVAAWPTSTVDGPAVAPTDATETVTLYDHAMIVAAIQALLADPANTELRDQVVQAIRLRVAQDPVFRAEWRALLNA